jgi:DNA-binding CsgD family transcriptional regulator
VIHTLAGQDLRNDAIAARLFIARAPSRCTCPTSSKLGITTRAELAAQAAARS